MWKQKQTLQWQVPGKLSGDDFLLLWAGFYFYARRPNATFKVAEVEYIA